MELNGISNTNFNARIKFVGEGTTALKEAVSSNPLIQKYVSGKKNLLVKIECREATKHEIQRKRRDDELYRITFKRFTDSDSWFARFIDFFRSSVRLAQDSDHHAEHGNLIWLKSKSYLTERLDKLG
ncbi:MAG: hypothetical protein K6A44_06170 [bacterium]|nr:hypothetical protein [bacterium]